MQTGTIEYYGYGKDGRLLQDWSNRRQVRNGYVYLGNTVVGLYEVNLTNGTVTPKYQHTDALGSPVVTTNASKTVLSRMSYTPYGAPTAPMDGVGYTGHYIDVATQLTYMQQRYYDPQIGRFLSTDPIPASEIGVNFNRYAYANDNPYKFTDPDGRNPLLLAAGICALRPGCRNAALGLGIVAIAILQNSPPLIQREMIDSAPLTQQAEDGNEGSSTPAEGEQPKPGDAFPDRPLPRDGDGRPVGEEGAAGPHTQLGRKGGSKGEYPQAREFDEDGKPKREIDFTDHGRPNTHPNPHEHPYVPNPTGGTPQRGPAQPLTPPQ